MGLLGSQDDGKKPLFRNWFKQQKKSGIPECEIFDSVESIRLSSSEEWILIEGKESVAMINAESKLGKTLWETLQTFEGKLKGLKLIPCKGKLGFDLEPDDNVIVDWEWDDTKLTCVSEKSTSAGFCQKLTLENMQPPNVNEMNGKLSPTQSGKRSKTEK